MDRLAEAARDRRRHERPAEQGPVDVHQDRPRRGGALRHHRRHDRQRALRRVRPAHRLDGLHPVQPVSRDLRGRSRDGRARSTRSTTSICRARRPASRCRCRRSPPSRSAPRRSGSTASASSRPRRSPSTWRRAPRWARRSTRSSPRRSEIGMPRSITDPFPGRGARLPEVARQPAAADPGRHRHGLHRAGRALRELHPSDHDPVDPAVGRHRRAAGADAGGLRTSASSPSSASCC